MRDGEAGFTLVEVVIAVAIAVVLLAAGGVWMLSMRPGALPGATNDFDSALAATQQLAATSGNGATLAFVPRTDNGQGYVLHVYSGRPTADDAVKTTTIRDAVSAATISEATYGAPPFAIFLSSAGYPSGKAGYPAVDASGAITFPVIASQPACPTGGIMLTFRSANGVATRSLKCNVVVSGNATPGPSPTPNLPRITPPLMVAHWTNDRDGALRFRVAEFGYTGAFAKSDTACDATATFAANPVTAVASPNPDEPVAAFELYPIPHAPGLCTVGVADAYGQAVHSAVQIMGDLAWFNSQPSLSMQVNDVATLQFGKTYDSEALKLQAGGNCGGLISVSAATGSTPSSPGTTPARATLTVTAMVPGACTLIVGDQYGEPTISIPINVTGTTTVKPAFIEFPLPPSTTITWPPKGFASVGYTGSATLDQRIAKWINTSLGGGIAEANGAPSSGTKCYAIAFNDPGFTVTDGTDDSTLGTVGGCWEAPASSRLPELSATASTAAVQVLGYAGETFTLLDECATALQYYTFTSGGPKAYLGEIPIASTTTTACSFSVGDRAHRAPSAQIGVKLVSDCTARGQGWITGGDGQCWLLVIQQAFCSGEPDISGAVQYFCTPPISVSCENNGTTLPTCSYPYQVLVFYAVRESDYPTGFETTEPPGRLFWCWGDWTWKYPLTHAYFATNMNDEVSDTATFGDGTTLPDPNFTTEVNGAELFTSTNSIGFGVPNETDATANVPFLDATGQPMPRQGSKLECNDNGHGGPSGGGLP